MNRFSALVRRFPILAALAAQLAAWLLVAGGHALWLDQDLAPIDPFLLLAGHGVLAAAGGLALGLARWWVPVQFFLPFALAGALALDLPAWLYLLAFLALALVYWNAAGERVPLYLSNRTTWQALGDLLPESPATAIDLGAGLGGTLLFLARQRPDSRFRGVESAPLPYALARLRLLFAPCSNIELRFGNLWDQDLSAYDLVYCFLSPAPMARLFAKARAEMRPGSLLVSNSFIVPGHDHTLVQ